MSASTYYPGLPEDYAPRIHLGIVTATRRVGAGMLRITLGGHDMHDYPTTSVGDEYVRLFFPDRPEDDVRLPFATERGWDFADGVAPSEMRTYTIRAHRPGEVDIDFVEHDGGIAAAWAAQARPGQQVGVNPPKALYDRPVWARRQILVADEPALPAALRIAELTAADVPTTLVLEVRGTEHQLLPDAPGDAAEIVWLRGTGNGHAPSELAAAVRRADVADDAYVWVASETRVTREIRTHLRRERSLPADAYKIVGYWTDRAEEWRERYDALGEEFHNRVRELYDSDRETEEIVDEVQRLYEAAGL
ncbi:siderophore-interacting protein [Microbacterium marinilacus]|uniref:Siderophore-interacting protein n=1 Tax=Microbacterium marinilacus TaxID=415209 RepID=A0ABP7B4H1_9MICO|nr:siderophore-interacting protein [Microbacterium marinilacus]MBY0687883.1 siderophore-interacting protein [Microbacterium marinilacus]